MTAMPARSTTEVFQDHLAKRLDGDLDGDLEANYSKGVVFLTGTGTFHGWQGVRESAAELEQYVGSNAIFDYHHTLVEDEYAFLEWTSSSSENKVCDGADSFVVRDGKIIFQSIHYNAKT
jgi:hypothetical protein